MSKSALAFLLLALTSLLVAITPPLATGAAGDFLGTACATFVLLFILALIRGRRIKFNPLLR
ncbi:PA3371 family protein [Pseudomonas akapageensis]|uniref:PA3371 family protein n=1 Tax=Pseudomonas akapageensis TaxID=2609961 RepID=UPI0031B639AB